MQALIILMLKTAKRRLFSSSFGIYFILAIAEHQYSLLYLCYFSSIFILNKQLAGNFYG